MIFMSQFSMGATANSPYVALAVQKWTSNPAFGRKFVIFLEKGSEI